jgi:hypothetical protein
MEPQRLHIEPNDLGDMYEQAWKEWVESGDAELWDNLPWEDLDDVVAETEEGDSEAGCN